MVEVGPIRKPKLHDGLGPTLTSVAFRVDAAANTVRSDTDGAEQLMREVGADLRIFVYADQVGDGRRTVTVRRTQAAESNENREPGHPR